MGAAVPAPSLDSRYRRRGGVVEDGPGVELGQVRAGFAPRVRWGDPAQDPLRGQGFGGGARGLEDAFGGDVGAGQGGVQVGGFGVGAGGVEGDDGVAAAVLQPFDDVAQGGGGVQGGGEQGAGEDLFPGGVEERVASGAADGGHEVPGQPGRGFDAVRVGDLADRPQRIPPPLLGVVGDVLRVEHPHRAQLGAGAAGQRPQVGLVGGRDREAGRGAHGGHGEGAGLVRPRAHDDQGDVFPGHAHVVPVEAADPDPHLIARDAAAAVVREGRSSRALVWAAWPVRSPS